MRYGRKGFTLIELIIVIIIIGVLAAIAAAMMRDMTTRARRAEAIAALGTIRTAERAYYVEFGSYANVTDFSDAANPLNASISPGALNGRYYNEGSYSARTDYTVTGPLGAPMGYQRLYILFMNATTSGTTTAWTWIWMLDNGSTGDTSIFTSR